MRLSFHPGGLPQFSSSTLYLELVSDHRGGLTERTSTPHAGGKHGLPALTTGDKSGFPTSFSALPVARVTHRPQEGILLMFCKGDNEQPGGELHRVTWKAPGIGASVLVDLGVGVHQLGSS
jgi:hypothetical protein